VSRFRKRGCDCPRCGTAAELVVAISVNGGHDAELRDAILGDRFQFFTCEQCGACAVAESPLIYTDFGRREWIGMFPRAWAEDRRRWERATVELFEQNLAGPGASPPARRLAIGFRVRVVFGMDALREKLTCFAAGLDDAVVEALKLHAMRDFAFVDLAARPRLVRADGRGLTLRLPGGELTVGRDGYDAVAGSSEHAPLLERLRAGAWVDLGRA
jgi:hypothetical protein